MGGRGGNGLSVYLERFDEDLRLLRGVMQGHLTTDVSLIVDMEQGDYLIGGKQLRAVVTLLSSRYYGLPIDTANDLATAIEFIHTATLLHDDVIDGSATRRHLPTAARSYGNAAAVLAGDFLYSRSSQILSGLGCVGLLRCVADATNQLSEGEILQLLQRGKPTTDEQVYYSIIERKTASLFRVAATAAALVGGHDTAALACYGYELGIAFQLVDDCLDYEGEGGVMGKSVGSDFSEGKVTLPIIVMLGLVSPEKRGGLIAGWTEQRAVSFVEVQRLLHETNALVVVRERAAAAVERAVAALDGLGDSADRDALVCLARQLPERVV